MSHTDVYCYIQQESLFKNLFALKKTSQEANKVLDAYDFESLAQNMTHDKHLISPQYRLKTVKVRNAVGHGMV